MTHFHSSCYIQKSAFSSRLTQLYLHIFLSMPPVPHVLWLPISSHCQDSLSGQSNTSGGTKETCTVMDHLMPEAKMQAKIRSPNSDITAFPSSSLLPPFPQSRHPSPHTWNLRTLFPFFPRSFFVLFWRGVEQNRAHVFPYYSNLYVFFHALFV